MPRENVASLRTRAELARRLATELKEPKAVAALREIAEALDEEADKLECKVVRIEEAGRWLIPLVAYLRLGVRCPCSAEPFLWWPGFPNTRRAAYPYDKSRNLRVERGFGAGRAIFTPQCAI